MPSKQFGIVKYMDLNMPKLSKHSVTLFMLFHFNNCFSDIESVFPIQFMWVYVCMCVCIMLACMFICIHVWKLWMYV